MMKITVKTLNKSAGGKQDSFDVDISPEDTILQVKEKVQTVRPDFEAQQTKLVCAGRILQNDKTAADSNLKEGDFLVVIPGKKPAPSPPPEPATTAPTSAENNAQPAADNNATPAPGAAAAPVSTNREVEAALTQLTEMGFPRDQCEAALRAAYGNPDRAVEYLMNGIPAMEEEAAPPAAGAPGGGAPPAAGGGAVAPAMPAGGGPSGAEGFTGMAFPQMGAGGAPAAPAAGGDPTGGMGMPEGMPNMEALRAALQQNPAMLQQVLGQLGQTHPELLQMFQQNPEALMQVLAGQMGGGGGMPGMPGGMPGMGGGAEAGGAPPGAIPIALSEEDRAAVERLEQLGFPRHAVVQAYMAADKNEELAANLLFDMGDDM